MTNTFSKISDGQIRTASETRAILELQESKRCLATTTINKKMNEANCFAKGASKLRIADASQLQKKAVVNQKTIKLAQRISITEQKTNNSPIRKDRRIRIAARKASKHRKPANKRITVAKYKKNQTDHHRTVKHKQPITFANAIQQSYQKGPAN